MGTVPGIISVMYNVPGVTKLNLSASNLAKIFNGKITKWNDPAIVADNAGVTLPDLAIQAFHRSDASGTSFNFSNYLNKTAPTDFPTAANKQWPGTGGQSAQGSKGVAQAVKSTAGAVGYAEVSYATSNNLHHRQRRQRRGQVRPADRRQRRELHRQGEGGHRRRELPVQLRLHLRGRRRLPGRPGDLRDRLLHGQRLGQAAAAEGLPGLHGQQRARSRSWRAWATSPCPRTSRSTVAAIFNGLS